MITGIGNDIVEIDRIARAIEKYGAHFLDRIFTMQEQSYCKRYQEQAAVHFAGRFCAKEAISKALGVGIGKIVNWHDMEILNDEKGKPCVILSSSAKCYFENPHLLLSISHCRKYALATAIYTK